MAKAVIEIHEDGEHADILFPYIKPFAPALINAIKDIVPSDDMEYDKESFTWTVKTEYLAQLWPVIEREFVDTKLTAEVRTYL